ncbi:MAG: 3-hydroxyacyl-CoA dehydrogenase NAD-binding domain-containing protein [Pseudomonadota bacterium]
MQIKNVTIIGTGTLGTQIAMVVVAAGYQVKTFDTVADALDKNLTDLKNTLQGKSATPLIPFEEWGDLAAKIGRFNELGPAVAEADLVIEAVNEDLELKKKVFSELGRLTPRHAVLATNSSSLPVSRVEESSGRPERCLNLHFSRPLEGLHHVDLMGGSRTSPEIMDLGDTFLRSLGCLPLRVNREMLGFCFNRVWRAVKKEALHMWADGSVNLRDIDRGWMIFTGMKEGPFGFMDQIGLDVVYGIEMVYYSDSQDPGDHPPQALKDKIRRGELGVKSGKGFYSYPNPEYLDPGFLKP